MFKKNSITVAIFAVGIVGVFSIYYLTKESSNDVAVKKISSAAIVENSFEDWSEETHSKDTEANYNIVFPQDEVNRLDIVISEENWQTMLDDMESLYGSFGAGRASQEDLDEDPVFVESQVFFDDTQWYNVGIRFKGNSSLRNTWAAGTFKMPFKIDFDEFEDEYPELENQRFYGFKKLSLSSNYDDASLLREKIATEAFDGAGVAAPETAFYEIYIDHGDGSTYFGLYTAVEVVDDTVIDGDFDDSDGNLYKAEGDAASLSVDMASLLDESFFKKTNEDDDWSDLEQLSAAINSDTRESDSDAWKESLEEIFDTDAFLNWLAVNTVIQNWDTYGNMTHNYYLYNDPDTGKFTWIPWDNNESFLVGKRGGALSLTFNEVSDDWPLIRYMIDDEEYREVYVSYVNDFLENTFNDDFIERMSFLHDLIEPYAIGESGEQEGYTFLRSDADFTNSITELITHIEERIIAAAALSLDDDWTHDESMVNTAGQDVGGGRGAMGGGPPFDGGAPPQR